MLKQNQMNSLSIREIVALLSLLGIVLFDLFIIVLWILKLFGFEFEFPYFFFDFK
jgi:hypothetical protein